MKDLSEGSQYETGRDDSTQDGSYQLATATDTESFDDQGEEAVSENEIDFLQLAVDSYASSELYVDAYLRKQWEDGLKQWQGKHQSNSKYTSDAYKTKSKLFRPRTRAAIRKNEAEAAAAYFSTEKVVNVTPLDDNNELDVLTAEIAGGMVNYRLDNTIPWFMILNGAYQSGQVHGQICSYQHWKYGGGNDEPCIDLRPIENIRIDPGADWLDPVNSSPYFIDLIPMYVGDIREKFTIIDNKTGEPEWNYVPDGVLLSAANEYYDSTRIQREETNDPKANLDSANNAFSIAWVRRNIIREAGQDWVFYTLGGEVLLSEPKKLEEVYFTGERPYVIGCVILEAHKAHPSSLCKITADVQKEINDTCNMRMDNVKFVLNKRYFVKRNRQVDTRSLTRNGIGSVTMMEDPNTDVKVVSTPDVTSSAFQEQDRLNLDFDDLAGTFSGSSVQGNRKLNETVGGMNLMSQSANLVSEYQLRTFNETWVEPVLKQLVQLELKYETDPVVKAIAGGKSEIYKKYGFDEITDGMLNGNLVVKVNVGTGATNPQTQIERFFYGLSSLSNVLGERFIEKIDIEEVVSEVFGKLGYKDGSRFFKQDDEEGEQDPRIVEMQQMIEQLNQQLMLKYDPKEQEAKVEKLNAESEFIKANTANKSIESTFSAMSSAEKVAMVPQIVPIADEILASANYQDHNGRPVANMPNDASIPYNEPRVNTNPNTPPNPGVGVNSGIETGLDN